MMIPITRVLGRSSKASSFQVASVSVISRFCRLQKSSVLSNFISYITPSHESVIHKYTKLLELCITHKSLVQAMMIHAHLVIHNIDQDSFLSSKLILVYSVCGEAAVARLIFNGLIRPTIFSFNSMIRGYVMNGMDQEALGFFYQGREEGFAPDSYTYSCIVKACASLSNHDHGKKMHKLVEERRLDDDVHICNALISMYSKFGCLSEAVQVFDKMPKRDLVSWNSIIACYVQNGLEKVALEALKKMLGEDFRLDQVTIISVLSICTYATGRELHGYIVVNGFESTVVISNSLVSMYGKCGKLDEACRVFNKLTKPDRVTWNTLIATHARNGHFQESLRLLHAMQIAGVCLDEITYSGIISAFSQNDHPQDALIIFVQMLNAGLKPDAIAIASVLSALSDMQSLDRCKEIHGYSFRRMLEADKRVKNALVSVYCQCGSIQSAENVFANITNRDVISWSSMIVGYSKNVCFNEAIRLFRSMNESNTRPNPITVTSILSACAGSSSLQHGKELHSWTLKFGFYDHTFVGSALIDMYAKCGRLVDSRRVFDAMTEKNLVSWNVMIAGYAIHGQGNDALKLFKKVEHPDEITFLAALSACSHGGLVEEGIGIFNKMKIIKVRPREDHYACMVDILGRAGCLDQALDMIKYLPREANIDIWGALLGACRTYHNLDLGLYSGEQMLELGCDNPGFHVLLSNIFAAFGRWKDVETLRKSMKEKGLRKKIGCSWIEVNNRVHSFVATDRARPEWGRAYQMLMDLNNQIKDIIISTN